MLQIKTAIVPSAKAVAARIASDQIMLASNMLQRLGMRDDMQVDETSLQLAGVVGQLTSRKGALLTWNQSNLTNTSQSGEPLSSLPNFTLVRHQNNASDRRSMWRDV